MAVAAYQLKSELARFCLPAPERDSYRRLAWVNSLCLMFLLIGVFGAQNKLPVPKHAAPLEQPVPVVIEPLPATPPPTESKTAERQDEDQKPKAQSIVAVTLNSPAINFSVPTIGNLIVPVSAAPAPPGESMAQTAPATARNRPIRQWRCKCKSKARWFSFSLSMTWGPSFRLRSRSPPVRRSWTRAHWTASSADGFNRPSTADISFKFRFLLSYRSISN